MASADLSKELECSICLSLYTDPVILQCGHNFCRACIDRVLETQHGSGVYSCPECREEFLKRPPLQRNLALRNIVENFRATHPDREESYVYCTYCIHSSVPAVKCCLLCEASLCEDHLRVHSKSPEHVLSDATTSSENKKCSIHKKALEYYCEKDAACICVVCKHGPHQGHHLELLHKAFEKKKNKLRNVLQELKTKEKEVNKNVQSLKKRQSKLKEQEASETGRVGTLFRDVKRQLDDLETRILSEISRQVERLSCSDMIQQLEIKRGKLSAKVLEIEKICDLTNPISVLQNPVIADLYKIEEEGIMDRGRYDKQTYDDGDLDVTWVSKTLSTGLSDILLGVTGGVNEKGPADILLEEDTASNDLNLSDDRKTATKSSYQARPKRRKRFQDNPQVLSIQNFSSGRHYWDVDVGRSNNWIVGVCYPSIPKKGDSSVIGYNSKSWGLDRRGNEYVIRHNNEQIRLPMTVFSSIVRIYLDYEGGQLSFYDLCNPIRHLYTFATFFTEPLHAAFFVDHCSINIYEGGPRM